MFILTVNGNSLEGVFSVANEDNEKVLLISTHQYLMIVKLEIIMLFHLAYL